MGLFLLAAAAYFVGTGVSGLLVSPLRFSESLPVRDIAARWNMDPDALHRAYAKARKEFRVCLREVVSFHAVRTEVDLDAECRRLIDLLD